MSVRRSLSMLMLVGLLVLAFSPVRAGAALGGFPPFFAGLTFSATSDGATVTYFPVGTKQVFARWDYGNMPIPQGQTLVLRRQWYINGKLFLDKSDAWDYATLGYGGHISNISIYDLQSGLTPGYYHVIINLVPDFPGAQVEGDFVIASPPVIVVPPVTTSGFSDLTVSTSGAGPSMNAFPAGTPLISARWNYANIPIGAVVQRDWYINGMRFRSVQEPWSSYWGTSGRLTHVAIYDYDNGMASGNYRLIVFLRDNPSVRAEVTFTVGTSSQPNGSTPFNNLTFSTSPDGAPSAIFPTGTREVFARWDFAQVPSGTIVLRRWFRNGALWLERQEPWAFGTQGTVKSISIYDYDFGLLSGDYTVEISLIGYPNSMMRGYFTIN